MDSKKKKKGCKKKAQRKAAKAKSAEMKEAAAEAPKDDGKKKDAEDRSTLVDKKRTKLSTLLIATIGIFNGAHKAEYNRPITRRELAASMKITRDALIEKKVFKKYERPKKNYAPPATSIGQTITVEVLAGNDKGKKITGVYIDWKPSNGCAKVYGTIEGGKPKNHWGRPVTAAADPKENDDSSTAKAAS